MCAPRRLSPRYRSILLTFTFLMLSATSSGAAPPVRPATRAVPHPVEMLTKKPPVSQGEPSHPGNAEIGSTTARDPASILGTKAVAGHIEQQADIASAKTAGTSLLNEDFHDSQRRGQEYLSMMMYDAHAKDKFKEAGLADLEASISSLSGRRGYIIFTGNWTTEASIIKLSRSQSFNLEYALIKATNLAYATLYLPYLTGSDTRSAATSLLQKATAPIVAVEKELFSYVQGKAIRHRELFFDPRADVRVFTNTADNEPAPMTPVKSRQLEFEPGKAEPATIKQFLGCCVYVRPPAYGAQLLKFLKSIRFNVSQMRVALMVHDSATRAHLAADALLSGQGRAEAIDRSTTDIEPWVVKQLKKAAGGTCCFWAMSKAPSMLCEIPAEWRWEGFPSGGPMSLRWNMA